MTDQMVLRVREDSEIGRALKALQERPLTDEEIKLVGGKNRTHWLIRQFPKWFENISIKKTHGDRNKPLELEYTDIQPNQVDVIGDLNISGVEITKSSEKDNEDALRWPVAPQIIEEMDNFDKPRWFELMKAVVSKGKHIALEGPPGVGKDTAVQQLAAQERKVLVTIGGDAGFRRRDLVGTAHISNGSSRFEVGEYVAAAVNGWWVLLTEVNAADPDALMYINAQLAPPYVVTMQGRAFPVHEDFRIFVSYNHGLIGTKPLPQSFKDRFFSIKVPFFTEAGLRKRLQSMGMSLLSKYEMANSIVIQFGLQMWDAHVRGQMRYQVTTRRLSDALMLTDTLGYPAKDAITKAVIAAIDSPVEAKAASTVLDRVLQGVN